MDLETKGRQANEPLNVGRGASANLAQHDAGRAPPLHPIQDPWFVGFMMFATFGLYSIRYMYRHARDLRNHHGEGTQAWVWAAAALIPVSLPFLLQRMTQRYGDLADKIGFKLVQRGRMLGICILLTYIASSVYETLSGEFYGYSLTAFMVLVGVFWGLLTQDVNAYKRSVIESQVGTEAGTEVETKVETETDGKRNGRVILALIVATPGALLLVFLLYLDIENSSRSTVAVGEPWELTESGIEITFADPWRPADIGTNSDGQAIAEFTMSTFEWLIIFDQTDNMGAHDITHYRRTQFYEDYPGSSCEEQHYLKNPDSLVRISELYCEASYLGDPHLQLSTVIDNATQTVELLSESLPAKRQLEKTKSRLRRVRRI